MTTYISSKNIVVGEKDGYAEFVVTLSAAAQQQVSVYYNTYSLTASGGTDFDSMGGQLVFAPGVTSQSVRVPIKDDAIAEGLENFALVLNNPTNGVISNPAAVATIVDNDTLADGAHHAALSVRDVVVDAGAGTATFAVVLDKAVGSAFSVAYNTVAGSAAAGSDFVPASGTLSFGAGETVKTVTVTLPQDGAAEPAEMFNLVLGAVSGGAGVVDVADGIGQATIGAHGQTARAQPAISVNNPFVGEKDGYVDFVVTLDAPSQGEVSVYYNTYSLSASGGVDFETAGGQLVFAPGVTTQVVRVTIADDLKVEGLETFALTLTSPANAIIANFAGVATIVDNDTLADSVHHAALSVRDVVVDAGADTATFAVVLDKAVGGTFSVAYDTVPGTAAAGSDFVAANGTLSFGPGETVKTVTVALPHDATAEPAEMFNLVLGALSGNAAGVVEVADGIGQATIGAHGQTARAQPAISVSNPFVGEKDGYVDFVVTLDAPSQNQVSVYYNTYSLSASGGVDFETGGGQLVFAPGVTTQVVRVTITDDLDVESLETLAVTLTNPSNAVIANFAGVATIVDNDTLADSAHHAGLSVRDVVVDASADTVTFAVVLDKAVGGTFSVAYGTADGNAVAGSDYVAADGTLTFGAGETVKTVTVALPHGGAAEPAEMFSLVLGALSGSAAGVVDVMRGSGHAVIGAHGQANVAQPLISVADAMVGEKDGYVDFVVTLNAPSASTVEVYYDTRSGTADFNDFESAGGKLVFAPGTTTQTVRVTIDADTRAEALESFSLSLGNPTNATLAKPSAIATIVDDASLRQVNGGAGLDTAAYGGARADYAIAQAAGGGFTVTAHGDTDLLNGVERLHFGDTNVALDIDGIGGQAYRIYQAAFNRTPDKGGLGFWMNAMDHGTTLTEVAAGFMQSKEFVDIYGAAPSNLDLVSKIYMNVLHRPAEQAGLDYWTNALDQHLVTAAQALGMISESAENQGAVAAIIGNGFDYTPYG